MPIPGKTLSRFKNFNAWITPFSHREYDWYLFLRLRILQMTETSKNQVICLQVFFYIYTLQKFFPHAVVASNEVENKNFVFMIID